MYEVLKAGWNCGQKYQNGSVIQGIVFTTIMHGYYDTMVLRFVVRKKAKNAELKENPEYLPSWYSHEEKKVTGLGISKLKSVYLVMV